MKISKFGQFEEKNKICNLRSIYCQEIKKVKGSKTTRIESENVLKTCIKMVS